MTDKILKAIIDRMDWQSLLQKLPLLTTRDRLAKLQQQAFDAGFQNAEACYIEAQTPDQTRTPSLLLVILAGMLLLAIVPTVSYIKSRAEAQTKIMKLKVQNLQAELNQAEPDQSHMERRILDLMNELSVAKGDRRRTNLKYEAVKNINEGNRQEEEARMRREQERINKLKRETPDQVVSKFIEMMQSMLDDAELKRKLDEGDLQNAWEDLAESSAARDR